MTPLTPAEMDARIARYAAAHPEAFCDESESAWFEALAARQRAQVVVTDAAPARIAEREQRQREQVVILAEAVQVAWLGTAVDAAYAPLMRREQGHEAATITALADATRAARDEARR